MDQFEDKMKKSINALAEEYGTIRAGRANPHVLDKIMVDYYGTPSPLQTVANISVPEARVIQIQPWEASLVKEIEKAISTGFSTISLGKRILRTETAGLTTLSIIMFQMELQEESGGNK